MLAGGASRRFGAEKAAATLHGRPLLAIAAGKLQACAAVAISARRASAAAQFARQNGYPVLHDDFHHPSGPLAGVHTGLAWAEAQGFSLLAVLPVDAPLIPDDTATRLAEALREAKAVFASTADGDHPLCALWRVSLLAPLGATLAQLRHPPVHAFLEEHGAQRVRFDDAFAFINVNTADELARIERGPASKP